MADILEMAGWAGAERVMFTGRVPVNERSVRHWLLVRTPGWSAGWADPSGRMVGHWLGTPVTGRFERAATGQRIEVRTAAEWFGNTALSPGQARLAWDATAFLVGEAFKGQVLGKTPAATGTNLWAASLPAGLDPEPVTDDIAQELHRTTGQHHLEHLVAGPASSTHEDCVPLVDPAARPRLGAFAYVDGRFMYAALCRELGTGPGTRLNRADTVDLLDRDPYARARVLVRFKVPESWNHVGVLGVQHRDPGQGWYYPNRPGAAGQAWADTAELHVARKAGWMIDPLESVAFTKTIAGAGGKAVAARPLDTFANRVIRIRELVDTDPEMPVPVKAGVSAALRAIMIQTIGAFASRGRASTVVAWSPQDVPAEYLSSMERKGEAFVYRVSAPVSSQQRPYYRPELAVQVWARGRARVLLGPSALGAGHGRGVDGASRYLAGHQW
ncbi:hypothetical protein [Arthrobacter sp. CJ23]|uniref:hypothetical protein n=1 Tax=Arthrobacter sp. CJ23 TaxID=2972479 RepID=UPI00215C93B2|nr:hypothetical protein [Arthrobacter sp. CJ23]UVJ37799.1 hypothetical protein NVV90_10930 [Arthrobacter sp. CJ23]